MKALLIPFWLVPTLVVGQISNALLKQFPNSLKPVDPKTITYNESVEIIKASRFLGLASNQEYLEIDRPCGKITPLYKSFDSKERKIEHVELIRYWLNGITKPDATDSAGKYVEIYRKLIGRDTKKYDSELANYFFFKGFVLIEERLYPQAYAGLLKSIRIYKEKKNYLFVAYAFGLLSYMYRELTLYQMAINCSDSSMFYFKVWNDKSKIDPNLSKLVASTMQNGKART